MDFSQPFKLGIFTVTPRLNTIEGPEGIQTVTPKTMRFLLLLLEHQGEPVSQQTMLDTLWPEQVVSDSSIYQVVAQLRKVLKDDKDKGIIERVSRQGYRITLTATPSQPKAAINLKVIGGGAAFFLMTLVLWLVIETSTTPAKAPELDRLTITPIEYDDNEYQQLATSIRDTLVTKLVPVAELTVIHHEKSAQDIASGTVLSGKVYRHASETRINITLTDTDTNQVVWAKLFTDISQPEQEIAEALFRFIDISSRSDMAELPLQSAANNAYEEYLLARFLWDKRTPVDLLRAKEIYENMQTGGQLFPLASVGLCETYYFLHLYSDWTLAQASALCEPLLDDALETSPQLGQAIAARANLFARQKRFDKAEADFKRAIDLAPNYAMGHYWYGFLLREQGEYQSSLERFQQAYVLSPMSAAINLGLAYAHLNIGQGDKARHYYQRALTLNPGNYQIPVMDLDFYWLTPERAERFMQWAADNQKSLQIQPNYRLTKAMVHLYQRNIKGARTVFDTLKHQQVNPAYRYYVEACLYVSEGQLQKALESLQARYEKHGEADNYARPLIAQLVVMNELDKAATLIEKHFADEVLEGSKVNRANRFLQVQWLMSQQEPLTKSQLLLRNELDQDFAQVDFLLAAEWWAYRGEMGKVKDFVSAIDTEAPNFFDDHLIVWRQQRLLEQWQLYQQKRHQPAL